VKEYKIQNKKIVLRYDLNIKEWVMGKDQKQKH